MPIFNFEHKIQSKPAQRVVLEIQEVAGLVPPNNATMAPPNYDSYHGPASNGIGDGSSGGNGGGVVYERHGHYTTTTARVGTGTGSRPTYTTPTKPPSATAGPSGGTPSTVVDESFDSAGGIMYGAPGSADDDLNSELAIADDGHEAISHEQRSSQVIAAAAANAAGGSAAPGAAGPYAHNGRNDNMTAHARAGVRGAPLGPMGYQIPAGGGGGGGSNASPKSGVPRHSPIPAGAAAGGVSNGAARSNNNNNGGAASAPAPVVTAPPLMSIKTKKKKSSSSRSKKYEEQIAAEAAVARYYAEEEPYDVGGGNGGSDEMRINGGMDADFYGDGYGDLRQPRPVRPAAATVAATAAVNAAMDNTNPFDDSFDTAAASNIADGAISSSAHNSNPDTTSAAARDVNVSDYDSSVPSTPTSAIKAVKARQQRLQQEQQQRMLQQQQRQREQQAALLQRISSTDSAATNKKTKIRGGGNNSGMNTNTNTNRAEKTPTPTNANLSVPRAPSNASTHVGPLDEMTIMSAETGESWKRAEEEFAAAEAAARRERASWEQQGRVKSRDENDDDDDFAAAAAVAAATAAGKKQQQASAAATTSATAGGNKRQGILKTSSARTKPVGRNHPWDRKSSAGSNAAAHEDDEDDNTLFEFEDEASKKQRAELKASRELKRAERRASAEEGIKKSMSHDSAMSGSSFDRRRSGGGTRARRGRSYDDDESQSTAGPTLQDRTQEAWKRKNAVPRTRSAPRAGRSGSAVAFAQDTIHHFENDDESTIYTKESTIYTKDSLISARNSRRGRRDDEAYSDDGTYNSRRTTGTDYSGVPKSYESEVEDLVKDFLFIGRSAKSQPGSKRKKSHYKKDRYRDEESTSNDDGTIATYDESTYGGTRDESTFVTRDESTYVSRDSRMSVDDQTYESADPSLVKDKKMKNYFSNRRSARVVDDDDGTLVTEMSVDVVKKSGPCGQEKPCGDDNPLAAVWELMEGGFDAMSQALGLSGDAKEQEGTTASNSISRGQSTTGAKRSATADAAAGLTGLVDYASDYVFGPAPSQDTGVSTDEAPSSRHITPTHSLDASMDKEAGLVELSLCAAKAKHMTAGVPFNESAEIDVVNDIKFNVITTALPLGLLFQENSAGCWVSKIFATGNAANAAVGKGVQVGDQLAAVNGNSTIKLTVDEVCDMISSSPNTNEIELTFLRYVGPLQSNKKRGKARSPSPIRRSKGSGLFNRSASPKPSTPVVPAVNDSSSAPPPKQKKGFFGRTRSKSNPRPQAPVPSISESASSDFLGEYDGTSNMGTSHATGATGKSKKKKGFFGRKKK